jgi:transcriptional regulator with XRE-family HTH domain
MTLSTGFSPYLCGKNPKKIRGKPRDSQMIFSVALPQLKTTYPPTMEQENSFTLMEKSAIGRNISLYRKMRGVKAWEVAEKLGIKEAAYTRYERGEGSITIEMVRQVGEALKVDPLHLIASPHGSLMESGNNSPNAIVALQANNCQTINDKQLQLTLKLIESVTTLNDKLIGMISKK